MLPGIKLFDLTNKTAIVTGGSKGLGLAMAETKKRVRPLLKKSSLNTKQKPSQSAQR